jgi:hypothetical protein
VLLARVQADRAAGAGRLDAVRATPRAALEAEAQCALVAWDLHHGYTAIEALLERVLRAVDGEAPAGRGAHVEIIEQARIAVPGLRPALVSEVTARGLHELRAFRHFVRHGYAAELDPARLAALITLVTALWAPLSDDLDAMERWLEALAAA